MKQHQYELMNNRAENECAARRYWGNLRISQLTPEQMHPRQ